MKINESPSNLPSIKPVKEIMGVNIDGINPNIPHKNGFIYTLIGSPGTGKSSLLLSLFKSKDYYKMKFEKIFLITPESSFLSVQNHPFKNHSNVYHELDESILQMIYEDCLGRKQESITEKMSVEHSCLIIDDFASELKNQDIINALKRILTKSRHIALSIVFTLQAYNLFPMVLRKMITNVSIFKPKNKEELVSLQKEIIPLNKEQTELLMDYVYSEPYSHLDIDTGSGELRKNFNLLTVER